jgi:phenol 2-monooxygenase
MAEHYDVIICGGGPVGLLLAFQLARLGIPTLIIEQFDKTQQDMYGRASTLYPRTIEMLDQLGLLDEMAQVGLIGRASVTYKDGQKVQDRGWDFLNTISDTFLTYCLNIRQKYSEDIFRRALEQHGGKVNAGWTLKNFIVDDKADDYKIAAEMTDRNGATVAAKSKYIIGADGGKSSVRQIAGIPFIGERSAFNWIRIDAVINTDMPQSRIGFGAIESATHGNVLWVALDHGRSRIGFALPKALYEQYGEGITENVVKQEAAKAMAPFKIEFVSVDWWTLYSIGQRVAETFQHQDRVLLAGDAAHTHSSGAAQGMNTGVHDAVNLAWKLGGVLKGWYKPEVLETYSPERRAIAQHLIKLDKLISTLISGHIPESYTGNAQGGDANSILLDVINSTSQFTIGLGVAYEPDDLLNRAVGVTSVRAGRRAPDVLVRKPGSRFPTRLYELTKNNGVFWVVVFAGEPLRTAARLRALRAYLDSADSFTKHLTNAFDFLTIIAGTGLQPDEALGVDKFGHACYDVDHSAYTRYGISTSEGAIVVLRPDGILATAAELDQGVEIGRYLDAIVSPQVDGGRGAHNKLSEGMRLKSWL